MGTLTGLDLADLELRSERVLLRRWQPGDAARVHAVMRDRTMFDFLALPDPYTVQHADEFVTGGGHEGRDDGDGLGSAVVDLATDEVVGAAALRMSGYHPEIGFWVAPDARGHGYAAEATRLLTDFGFGVGLRRIGLFCDVRNLGSARTALQAGFRFEGVLRDGAPVAGRGPADLACFGRLADDPPGPVAPTFAPLPPGGLTDGVITVRVLRPDDAAAHAEAQDEIARGIGFGGPDPSPADAARIVVTAGLDFLVGRRAGFAVVDDESGAYAGGVTLRQGGPPGVGGIGYTMHPRFRGRGYTTRALRLLAGWAFEHGFARLELGAKVENVASQRAALAAGFEPDGVRRARLRNGDGSFADELRYALLAPHPSPTSVGVVSEPHPEAQPE